MPHAVEGECDPFIKPPRKTNLHDNIAGIYGYYTAETASHRLESQELRQLVHQALEQLTADELRVVELRFQHKKSPGQVASKLSLARGSLTQLESSALGKIRAMLLNWHEDR